MDCDVLIVGAGISGISAARKLLSEKLSVIILEGNSRIGGRIYGVQVKTKDGVVNVDAGAAWVHGSVGNPIYTLAKQYKLGFAESGHATEIYATNGTPLKGYDAMYSTAVGVFSDIMEEINAGKEENSSVYMPFLERTNFNRPALNELVSKREQFEISMQEAWDAVLKHFYEKAVERDDDDTNLESKLIMDAYTDKTSMAYKLLMFLRGGHEQYEAASFGELSLCYDDDEESISGGDYCIKNGYSQLITKLVETNSSNNNNVNNVDINQLYSDPNLKSMGNQFLDIRLDHFVNKIDYSKDGVTVHCTNGATFKARFCVSTIPLGVMQKKIVEFIPPIPLKQQESIDKLGFGVMNKIIMSFPEVFWNENLYSIIYLHDTPMTFRWWWNAYPNTKQPILIAFHVHKVGVEIESLSNEEITSQAMNVLKKIYGNIPDPIDVVVTRWGANPFSYGSYSFPKVGGNTRDRIGAALPLKKKVFFAGEHVHTGYFGCVHGAFESGIQAAEDILKQHNAS